MNASTRILVAALLSSTAAAATAMTTLTYEWTDVRCGIVAPDGTRQALPCPGNGPSFTARVQPGESVFVTATLAYRHHDDGLLLDRPETFQVDPSGLRSNPVYHEASSLYFASNACLGRYCRPYPHWTESLNGPFSVLIGDNAVADDLSGGINFSATAGLIDSWYGSEMRTAYFGVSTVRTFSQVNAVPEPSTYALLLAGLLLTSAAARRRTRR